MRCKSNLNVSHLYFSTYKTYKKWNEVKLPIDHQQNKVAPYVFNNYEQIF
jgi:hypothetical protein